MSVIHRRKYRGNGDAHCESDHGIAQIFRYFREDLGVLVVRDGLDDRPCPFRGVT